MSENTSPKEHEEIEMTELQPCLSANTGVDSNKSDEENKETNKVRTYSYMAIINMYHIDVHLDNCRYMNVCI